MKFEVEWNGKNLVMQGPYGSSITVTPGNNTLNRFIASQCATMALREAMELRVKAAPVGGAPWADKWSHSLHAEADAKESAAKQVMADFGIEL